MVGKYKMASKRTDAKLGQKIASFLGMTLRGYIWFLVVELFVLVFYGVSLFSDPLFAYLPFVPAAVVSAIVEFFPRCPKTPAGIESVSADGGMEKLILRVDESFAKMPSLPVMIGAARAVEPLLVIVVLIGGFAFLVSFVSLPFASKLTFSATLIAVLISLLAVSTNYLNSKTERLQRVQEGQMFADIKVNYDSKDYFYVRGVIRQRMKSGDIKLGEIFQVDKSQFTPEALAKALLE